MLVEKEWNDAHRHQDDKLEVSHNQIQVIMDDHDEEFKELGEKEFDKKSFIRTQKIELNGVDDSAFEDD